MTNTTYDPKERLKDLLPDYDDPKYDICDEWLRAIDNGCTWETCPNPAEGLYWYARQVIKGPWPEVESVIGQHREYAFYYATNVLKGPFPAAETVIGQDSQYAYYYARYVLKAPFPAGESVIREPKIYAEKYEQFLDSLKTAEPV